MRTMLITLAILACFPQAASATSVFSPHAPGKYRVGFRVVEQYDFSRSYRGETDPITGKPVTGETARPIQTLIWYPAQPGGKAMTLNDYVRLPATEDDFDATPAERTRKADAFVAEKADGLAPQRLKAELTAPMVALESAKPLNGKFPVVIYAASFGSDGVENVDLCEFLASQGYIVIASPSLGAHTHDMTTDL